MTIMSFVSSESEESGNESLLNTKESDLTFVAKYVRDNPIILNKGKTPAINKKKQDILATLKQQYESKLSCFIIKCCKLIMKAF